ncbi:MAG: acetyl-CoA carboxylase carboxyl transferase subunit alpha, partial [Rhodospirillales bacterium]|nr:acetyl-CoA carboxylase carboxyl transferase subunit alpha [Rhodospirillales bacterium]
ILWRDGDLAQDAATALKLTAQDLYALGVIDVVVTEPVGGAHREKAKVFEAVAGAIADALDSLSKLDGAALKKDRREKFLAIGKKGLS